MTAEREFELSPTLNLLAALIGSLAYPNPDDDDWHGPGDPRVKGELAAIRRVTICVAQWAEHLGETAMAAESDAQLEASSHAKSPPPGSRSRGADMQAAADGDCDPTSSNCDPTVDGVVKKQPPTVAMAIIRPALLRFVHDLLHGKPVRLPVAVSGQGNPWRFAPDAGRAQSSVLLVAGAQLQFAAQATHLQDLRAAFQEASRYLIRRGMELLGHDGKTFAF